MEDDYEDVGIDKFDDGSNEDPICANCGVYYSEHAGMGCNHFSRTPSFVLSGDEAEQYIADLRWEEDE